MKPIPPERRTPPPPPPPVARGEMASALADVLEDQATKAKRRAKAPRPTERRAGPAILGLLAVLATVSAYLWFGNPAWLQPDPPEPLPLLVQDAGLRMEVYLQALRVEEFREREGRLPNTLEEAGDPFSEVGYVRLDGARYRLSLSRFEPDLTVEYDSGQPLGEFLGNAPQLIRGVGR